MEEWRYIEDTNNKYMISNYGKVKSFCFDKENGKILKLCPNGDGYLHCSISFAYQKNKTQKVHRLVAKYFVENDNPINNVVDHIDGDRQNNIYANLRWVSNSFNCRNIQTKGYVYDRKYKSGKIVYCAIYYPLPYKKTQKTFKTKEEAENFLLSVRRDYNESDEILNFNKDVRGKYKSFICKICGGNDNEKPSKHKRHINTKKHQSYL